MDSENATSRPFVAKLVVLGVWLVSSIATIAFVHQYTSWVPYGDEYDIVPIIAEREPLTLKWLWSPHNEHRIPLPRLVRYSLLTISGGDFRICVVGLPILMSLVALGTTLAVARIRGDWRVSDAALSLIILHWGQVENLIWGFQWCIFLPVALSLAVLCIGCWKTGLPDARGSLVAAICVLGMMLCGGGGLLAAVPLTCWLALACWYGYQRAAGARDRWYWVGTATAIVATWVGTAAYFQGLPRLPAESTAVPLVEKLRVAVAFLSTAFGMQFEHYWWLTGGASIVFTLGLSVLCWQVVRRCANERWRVFVIAATVAGCLLMAVAVGHGRANNGVEGGLQSRYTTFMVPLLCVIYFCSLVGGTAFSSPSRKWLGFAMLAFAIVLQANVVFGLNYGQQFLTRRNAFVRDFNRGAPSYQLAELYYRHPFGLLSPSPEQLDKYFMMLHEAKRPHFVRLVPSPPYRRLRISDLARQQVVGDNGVKLERLILPSPHSTRWLSMVVAQQGDKPTQLTVRWKSGKGSDDVGVKHGDRTVECKPGRRTVFIIPINTEIQELEFETSSQEDGGLRYFMRDLVVLENRTDAATVARGKFPVRKRDASAHK